MHKTIDCYAALAMTRNTPTHRHREAAGRGDPCSGAARVHGLPRFARNDDTLPPSSRAKRGDPSPNCPQPLITAKTIAACTFCISARGTFDTEKLDCHAALAMTDTCPVTSHRHRERSAAIHARCPLRHHTTNGACENSGASAKQQGCPHKHQTARHFETKPF